MTKPRQIGTYTHPTLGVQVRVFESAQDVFQREHPKAREVTVTCQGKEVLPCNGRQILPRFDRDSYDPSEFVYTPR